MPKKPNRVIPIADALPPRLMRIAYDLARSKPIDRPKKGLLAELTEDVRLLPGRLGGEMRGQIAKASYNLWLALRDGTNADVPPDPVPPDAPAVAQSLNADPAPAPPAADHPSAEPVLPFGTTAFNLPDPRSAPDPVRPCRVGLGAEGQRWGIQPFRW